MARTPKELKEILELEKQREASADRRDKIEKRTETYLKSQLRLQGVTKKEYLDALDAQEKEADLRKQNVENAKKTNDLAKSFSRIANKSQQIIFKSFGLETQNSKILEKINKEKAKGKDADQDKIKALNATEKLNQEFLNGLKDGNFVVEDAASKVEELKKEFEDLEGFEDVANKMFDSFPKAQEDADKISKALETEIPFVDQLDSLKKKAEEFSAIFVNATTAGLAALGFLVKKMVDFVMNAKKAREELGITASQSIQLSTQMSAAGASMSALSGDAEKAKQSIQALAESMGRIPNLSLATAREFGSIVALSGATAEEMASILELQTLVAGGSAEQAVEQIKSVEAIAESSRLLKSKVFADVADAAKTQALFFGKSAVEIAKSAREMRKLGIETSALQSVAETLLDLEGSISSEFELQALFGKTLNLNAARKAALERDGVALAQELRRQLGGQFDLNKANFAQVEALKNAFGLSQEQLQKVIQGQDIFNSKTDEAEKGAMSLTSKFAILGALLVGIAGAIVGALTLGAGVGASMKGAVAGGAAGLLIGGGLGAAAGFAASKMEDASIERKSVGSMEPAATFSLGDAASINVSKSTQDSINLEMDKLVRVIRDEVGAAIKQQTEILRSKAEQQIAATADTANRVQKAISEG